MNLLNLLSQGLSCECNCCINCKNEMLKNNLTAVLDRIDNKKYNYFSNTIATIDKYISDHQYNLAIKILNPLLGKMIEDLNILELNNYKSTNQCHITVKNEDDYRNKLLIVITKLIDCCYTTKEYINAEVVLNYVINHNLLNDIEIFKQSYTLALIHYDRMDYEMAHEYLVNLINNLHLVEKCDNIVKLKMILKYCAVLFKLSNYNKFLIEIKKINKNDIKELFHDFYCEYIRDKDTKNKKKINKQFDSLYKHFCAIISIYTIDDIDNNINDINIIIKFIEKFLI